MQIIFEKITNTAKIPERAHSSDAGLDFFADETYVLKANEYHYFKTGIKAQIPDGQVGLIWDKSGMAGKGLKVMGGVVDAGFRGEILINLLNVNADNFIIQQGQKIAQMLIQEIKTPEIIEGKVLNETGRGTGGFGSTGI